MDAEDPEPLDTVEEPAEEPFPASYPPASVSEVTIENNEAAHRFEARFPEGLALLRYRSDHDGALVLEHTEVPPAIRQRGVATRLVRTALEFARAHHLQVIPTCPFVAAYVKAHPESGAVIRAAPMPRQT